MINSEYCVIEMQESPHETVPRFVCVPSSWIRAKPTPEGTTAAVYPVEQFVATEGRILAGEPFQADWSTHIVKIVYECNDVNEGRRYAAEQSSAFTARKAEFPTPKTPAKRTALRSKSVDEYSINRGNKRRNIQDDIWSPQKDNSDNDKERRKIAREKKLLKNLTLVFKDMQGEFDDIKVAVANMYQIVSNIQTSLSKTTNQTDMFLNNEKNWQLSKGAYEMLNRQKSYEFPDDSDMNYKWTLRFREFQHGLEELLPGSKVYVRKAELMKLKTEADNEIIAARMLMEEIFSDYALEHCSLSGGKGGTRTKVCHIYPPPLDEYSRKILMMYLQDLAKDRGWEIDEKEVRMALRRRLNQLRK